MTPMGNYVGDIIVLEIKSASMTRGECIFQTILHQKIKKHPYGNVEMLV
jgi:hypothetical protein